MPAHILVGCLLAVASFAGLIADTLVIVAFFRGRMLSAHSSPIYLISSQIIIVDWLMLVLHISYLIPSIIWQDWFFEDGADSSGLAFLSSVMLYFWFHTSLSHIYLAVNRMITVVFHTCHFFTRTRIIVLTVLVHVFAIFLSAMAQYGLPCCRLIFDYRYSGYSYLIPAKDAPPNASSHFLVLPVNCISTTFSIICYSAIIITMRRARSSNGLSSETATLRRRQEYKHAMQFCVMAAFYLAAWATFHLFPVVISPDADVSLYSITVLCVIANSSTNALVYLANNQEIKEQKEAAAESDCSACYSNPCLNGGTCEAVLPNSFRCLCPDDTTGVKCEKKIVCTTTSCGKNADCFVRSHQINCVCKLGFSGILVRPSKGCTLPSRKVCFNGDPHYHTFDGINYSYQGTCPYIYSRSSPKLGGGYAPFTVKAKNELMKPHDSVSYVTSVQVEMYNQTMFVDKNLRVFFNGIQVHVPFNYPSATNPQITAKYQSNYIVVANDQFDTVAFQKGQVCLTLPDVDQFRVPNIIEGMSGDLNRNCKDDFKKSDGTFIPLAGCRATQSQIDDFADSWISLAYADDSACVDGRTMTNSSKTCDVTSAAAECQAIFLAMEAKGPLAGCLATGTEAIMQAYDACHYDVCRFPALKCSVLTTFVHACQVHVPNVNVHHWREDPRVQCAITCPAHSAYDECVTACPATCTDHTAPDTCTLPCSEGCACDYGYVLDNSRPSQVQCIRIQECGCTDPNGNFHPPDQPWLTDGCQQENVCTNGTFIARKNQCTQDAFCSIKDNQLACVCKPGYEGDGYTCTDINECLDPHTCSVDKGQGKCFNTPGSYYCECKQFFDGHDCEFYKPRRHCADLFVYHQIHDSGVYDVIPSFKGFNKSLDVYCDMQSGGGGWTLLSNALTTVNKTYAEYVAGFGDPHKKDVWLGLELIFGYTNSQSSSLRLNLFRCAHNGLPAKATYCTYDNFGLFDADTGYRACQGTELEFNDGWARWDLQKPGPRFLAFDNDNSTARCSETFQNTGFWFDTSYRCGSANLNGIRFSCDAYPPISEEQTFLFWGGAPINKAEMLLRPAGFPNYDHSSRL